MVLLFLCAPSWPKAFAQELPQKKQAEYIAALQARYFRARDAGLASFTCDVKVDLDTLPKTILLPAEIAGRAPLEATQLQLTMSPRGQPSLNKAIAPSASAIMLPVYNRFFDLVGNLITGFAATWGAKATNGPVPSARDVLSVTPGAPLTIIHLPDPGAKLEVFANDQLLVTKIVTSSPQQTIDEQTTFSPSPQGLLFTANDTMMRQGEDSTHIRYKINYQTVDGFQLPQDVRLVLNENIDLKFRLVSCTVQRGITLEVKAP